VEARIRELADTGVTDFAANEFGSGADEQRRTRQLLQSLLPR
jgi:hypothetical protein